MQRDFLPECLWGGGRGGEGGFATDEGHQGKGGQNVWCGLLPDDCVSTRTTQRQCLSILETELKGFSQTER